MNEDILIRNAKVSDAKAIAETQLKAWRQTNVEKLGIITNSELDEIFGGQEHLEENWKKRIQKTLDEPETRYVIVAEVHNQIVGYGYACKRAKDPNPIIKRLYILNEYQGIGIGKKLLLSLLEWIGDIRPVKLLVATKNYDAQTFYTRFGFRLSGKVERSKLMDNSEMVLADETKLSVRRLQPRSNSMPPSTMRRIIMEECLARGWSYTSLPSRYAKITVPGIASPILIKGTLTAMSNAISARISTDKVATLEILESDGFSVTKSLIIKNKDVLKYEHELLDFLNTHKELVVKPNDTSQGKCVRVGIKTKDDLLEGIRIASGASQSGTCLVQPMHTIPEFRLTVFNNRLVGASTRGGAFVVGDGSSTVSELIMKIFSENEASHTASVRVKKLDREMVENVAALKKYSMVLALGERMQIDEIVTDTLKGDPTLIDPKNVHADFAELAIKTADALKAAMIGIDVFATDVTKPLKGQNYFISELNASPGLVTVINKRAFVKNLLDELIKQYG